MWSKEERERIEKQYEVSQSKDINTGKEKYIARVKYRKKNTHLTPKKKKRK